MALISLRGRAVSTARWASRCVSTALPSLPCLIAALLLTGCSYVDRARQGSDLVVGVAEQYKLETLVQADIERQRVRAARCYSPLLTPATLSAAAVDGRLGSAWIDGLLQDCPRFSAFLSELMMRRAQAAGIAPVGPAAVFPAPGTLQPLPLIQTAPSPAATPGKFTLGESNNGLVSLEAVEP